MTQSYGTTQPVRLTLIYLSNNAPGMLISKKHYQENDNIEAEIEDFWLSLAPMTVDEILEFVRGDWYWEKDRLERLRQVLEAFIASDQTLIPFPKV